MKRVYIAGPMRGYPDLNFPAFDAAAARFRAAGWEVVNPAEEDRARGLSQADWDRDDGTLLREVAAADTAALSKCSHIALLPGSEKSKGAKAEAEYGRWIGLTFLDAVTCEPLNDSANPKDALGKLKPQIQLVSPASIIYEALAMQDGARKYGPYNWRSKKVESMTYIGAALRHALAYLDGEEVAADSGVPHLGHMKACAGILIDAQTTGNLIDNRPPPGAGASLIAKFTNYLNN